MTSTMVWTISRGFHRDVPQRGLGPAGRAALALAGIARAALALAGLIVGAEGHNRGCRLAGLACDRADVAGLGLGVLSLGGLGPLDLASLMSLGSPSVSLPSSSVQRGRVGDSACRCFFRGGPCAPGRSWVSLTAQKASVVS